MDDHGIERDFAEDESGVPMTPTDLEASRRPADEVVADDGSGVSGGASGGSGGGSGMPGHPDAT